MLNRQCALAGSFERRNLQCAQFAGDNKFACFYTRKSLINQTLSAADPMGTARHKVLPVKQLQLLLFKFVDLVERTLAE